jgi:hypothetical protein
VRARLVKGNDCDNNADKQRDAKHQRKTQIVFLAHACFAARDFFGFSTTQVKVAQFRSVYVCIATFSAL